jgi:Mg-chelatase subunit ChlD
MPVAAEIPGQARDDVVATSDLVKLSDTQGGTTAHPTTVIPDSAPGSPLDPSETAAEQARRWRLLLGTSADEVTLSTSDTAIDEALAAVYEPGKAGLGGSAPKVAQWLGDIRNYFPRSVVQVLQTDAIERLGLRRLLLEPEVLETVEPDVHLVATLVSLKSAIPNKAKATAREVVAKVVAELEKRLADSVRQSVRGALNRALRSRRPKQADIDWQRTIRANLHNWLPEYRTIVPERLVGFGRRNPGFAKEVILCVDQSGSMASSVVYASIFACVLASVRSLSTRFVCYDTSVVDLTDELSDPVEVIFGTQLGGGTDTTPALRYCAQLMTRPSDTVVVLISDLYDSDPEAMLAELARFTAAGAKVVVLLALSDDGAPSYSREVAAELAELQIPAFGCTPDRFGELMSHALSGADVATWAAAEQAAAAR